MSKTVQFPTTNYDLLRKGIHKAAAENRIDDLHALCLELVQALEGYNVALAGTIPPRKPSK